MTDVKTKQYWVYSFNGKKYYFPNFGYCYEREEWRIGSMTSLLNRFTYPPLGLMVPGQEFDLDGTLIERRFQDGELMKTIVIQESMAQRFRADQIEPMLVGFQWGMIARRVQYSDDEYERTAPAPAPQKLYRAFFILEDEEVPEDTTGLRYSTWPNEWSMEVRGESLINIRGDWYIDIMGKRRPVTFRPRTALMIEAEELKAAK